MKNIAAAVVLYNPDNEIIRNISTYLNDVEKVYAVDNSDILLDPELIKTLKSMPNLDYIPLQGNLGIAKALNIAANRAIKEGFEFLLTMDHDSSASENMIQDLYSIIIEYKDIGISAAQHYNPEIHTKPKEIITKDVQYTMASGNLISLYAFQKIGGFNESLFIDHVDHEYCLRLKENGFRIIKTNKVLVIHRLGRAIVKKILWFNLYPTNHSPIRVYYRTRNRLYICNKYKNIFPGYVKEDKKHFLRELLYISLAEKDIFNKFRMMYRGYKDYKKNKFGKIY
ncbi:MAG: glycosyltransferase family 2 protein [bacterium]